MGAKNHAIVMPDADKEDTINAIIGACFGSTGQRCMAIAVPIFVGDAQKWIPEIVERCRKMTVGPGEKNMDIAPIHNKAALEKVNSMIGSAEGDGAKVLLDGRNVKVEGYPNGNWIGQTVIDHVKPGMRVYDEEIFGPVMVCARTDTLQEAIDMANGNPWGNGSAIFTSNGHTARQFQHMTEAG